MTRLEFIWKIKDIDLSKQWAYKWRVGQDDPYSKRKSTPYSIWIEVNGNPDQFIEIYSGRFNKTFSTIEADNKIVTKVKKFGKWAREYFKPEATASK